VRERLPRSLRWRENARKLYSDRKNGKKKSGGNKWRLKRNLSSRYSVCQDDSNGRMTRTRSDPELNHYVQPKNNSRPRHRKGSPKQLNHRGPA